MSGEKCVNQVAEKGVFEMLRRNKFHFIGKRSLDVIVDIVRKFVKALGYSACEFSHLAKRSEQNFLDIKNALQQNKMPMAELDAYVKKLIEGKGENSFVINIPRIPVNVKSIWESNPPLDGEDDADDGKVNPTSTRSQTPGLSGAEEDREEEEVEGESPEKTQQSIYTPLQEELSNFEDRFLPPFPDEYTYKFTNSDIVKQRENTEWTQILAGEKKEAEKSLTTIHKSEMERYSRNEHHFSKDDWFGGGIDEFLLNGGKETSGEGADDDQDGRDDEARVNPYIVISSRKQGLFRDTLVDKSDDALAEGETRVIRDNIPIQTKIGKKRKRPVIVDDTERQRTKRFKIGKDSQFNQVAHDLLSSTVTYVNQPKKK